MDESHCNICKKKLRKFKYELSYIGNVCCYCFRISRDKYIKLVDEIASQNLEYINLEIKNINRYNRKLFSQ